MNLCQRIALALAAAGLASIAHATGVDPAGARLQADAFTSALKPLKVYHEVGNATGTAIPAGTITAYGSSQTVNCTATSGCYVMVSAEAQVAPTATESSTALCLKVDGQSTDSCPFLTRSSTSNYTSFSHRGGVSVGMGTHTVTTHVYVGVAATLFNYNTEVTLFKK